MWSNEKPARWRVACYGFSQMAYWLKVACCAVIILAFALLKIAGPEHPFGWLAIFSGIVTTLMPIAFIYLLMLVYKGDGKRTTRN